MGILDVRELSAEERQIAEDTREYRGVWTHPSPRGRGIVGDGRWLSQADTNTLIVTELFAAIGYRYGNELTGLVGRADGCEFRTENGANLAVAQRGGQHSEPAIRVIAFRTWGRRDLDWWTEVSNAVFEAYLVLAPGDASPIVDHGAHRLIEASTFIDSAALQWCGRFTCECLHEHYFRAPGP